MVRLRRINVDSDEAGIGWHLEWVRPVAEIAVFESKYRSPSCALYKEALSDPLKPHIRLLLFSCMGCAGCDPPDPEYPRLKPVGVYPVIDGWAYINLLEVAGRGQDFDSPL